MITHHVSRSTFRVSRAGFTLIELLIGIAIFGLVTMAVVTNFRVGEHTTALRLAAVALASQIQEAQTMAQTGRTADMCVSFGAPGSLDYCLESQAGALCGGRPALCSCECAAQIPPGGYGVRIDDRGVRVFADVDSSRRYEEGEELPGSDWALPKQVNIVNLAPTSPLDLVFTPPLGAVWIDACDAQPAGNTCVNAAQIILGHARLEQTRTVTVYRTTGRVAAE